MLCDYFYWVNPTGKMPVYFPIWIPLNITGWAVNIKNKEEFSSGNMSAFKSQGETLNYSQKTTLAFIFCRSFSLAF